MKPIHRFPQVVLGFALAYAGLGHLTTSRHINGIDAFGLNSDRARLIRLFFQPLLVIWALLSTGAWRKQHD
jgi:hypothetical protein